MRVAVLDSGVVEKHPFLDGRVDFDAEDVENPTLDDQGHLPPYAGHGTFIAGIVLQHAPGARVVAKKVFGGDGFVSDADLATALSALPEVEVVNLSLGGYSHGNRPMPATADALEKLLSRESPPVVVASVGNDGVDEPSWPAAFKRVISVAALDRHGRERAGFSNYGWGWVDSCTRGEDASGPFFHFKGRLAPIPVDHHGEAAGSTADEGEVEFQGWAFWSGTSFAAPRLAGTIASRIGPGADPTEAAFRLVGAAGAERRIGIGSVVDPPSYGWAHLH